MMSGPFYWGRDGLPAAGGVRVLRLAPLFETHLLKPRDAVRLGRGAVGLREGCGALAADLLHHLFVESQMRIGDDGSPDRLGVGLAHFAGDPFANRVHSLRRIYPRLANFLTGSFGQDRLLAGDVRGKDTESLGEILLTPAFRVRHGLGGLHSR